MGEGINTYQVIIYELIYPTAMHKSHNQQHTEKKKGTHTEKNVCLCELQKKLPQ